MQENLEKDGSEHAEAAEELVEEYKVRAERASIEGQDPETKTGQMEAQQRLRLVAIAAAREKLRGQTDQIDADAHRALGEELDLEEQQIRRALGDVIRPSSEWMKKRGLRHPDCWKSRCVRVAERIGGKGGHR